MSLSLYVFFFFFKQKTAYEMRISDWSSDVCSSDLTTPPPHDNLHVSWASLGILVQALSVYFFSAIMKSGHEWFPDFTGVYYALMLDRHALPFGHRSEEHTSELQSLMRISYAVFCLKTTTLLALSPYHTNITIHT